MQKEREIEWEREKKHIDRHTFAVVSNFSATVGVQEILRIVIPPNGIIPSDGTMLMVGKRLWSQTCNWKLKNAMP